MRIGIGKRIVATGAALAAVSLSGQVALPTAREAVLLRAERFGVEEVEQIRGRFERIRDPFYPEQPEVEASAPASVVEAPPAPSDGEILRAVAERIRPSGVMRYGSEIHLIFGERRIKAGDFISVTYEGAEYRLQLMKADTGEFVLRLNEDVISQKLR